jgi:hypothetical protein
MLTCSLLALAGCAPVHTRSEVPAETVPPPSGGETAAMSLDTDAEPPGERPDVTAMKSLRLRGAPIAGARAPRCPLAGPAVATGAAARGRARGTGMAAPMGAPRASPAALGSSHGGHPSAHRVASTWEHRAVLAEARKFRPGPRSRTAWGLPHSIPSFGAAVVSGAFVVSLVAVFCIPFVYKP